MPYADTITNHTRITVTSKRTGRTVVLLEDDPTKPDYKDPSVGKYIETGIPITECIDDSLDTLVFTVREYHTRELFKPFDIVKYTINDGIKSTEYEMCILSDHAKMVSRMNQTYTHTVTAIESTKILEKVKIFNLNLTNPHDDLLAQFEKALANAEPVLRSKREENGKTVINFERKCRFAASERLRILGGKPGEDFFFGNTDLRTVLDSILSKINARVCVDRIKFDEEHNISKIFLGYRSMTATKDILPVWSFEEHGEVVGEEMENNGQDVAGTIFARGYNTLSDEPITFTSTFKSENDVISDKSACVIFPFPIGENGLEHFIIRMIITGYDYKIHIYNVDIASRIVPMAQFELLSEDDRKVCIPFEAGSNKLSVGSYTTKNFLGGDKSGIVRIIQECSNEQYGVTFDIFRYYNHSFTITYYPQVDTVATHAKPNAYDKDELLLGISDSQSENTLNMQRHGRRLTSLIKRTGNDEYYLDVQAKYYSKLLPLMSKMNLPTDNAGHTDKDYVLFKREIAMYDHHLNCRYYFSKDYNAVQENAGVQREKHIFDIPLESDECPLVVRKFMVFGFNKGNAEEGFFPDFVGSALRTLTCENEGMSYVIYEEMTDEKFTQRFDVSTGKVNFLLFSAINRRADGREEVLPGEGKVFFLPCLTYGQGTTMNFVARPLDNYSVDYSRDGYKFSIWGDAGHLISYNRYVSDEETTAGECVQFRMILAFEYSVLKDGDVLFSDYEERIKKFPVVEDKYFATCMSDSIEFDYYKDRTQKPIFCHTIACVPTASAYGKIIIGSAFCRDNNLVRENGEGFNGAHLIVSRTLTVDSDEDFLLPNRGWEPDFTFVGGYFVRDYFEVKTMDGSAAQLRYKGGLKDEDSITAWAIINTNGEVYIAVNGRPCDIYAWIMDFPE